MLPLCFSIKGIRLILPNSCVRWLSVCILCRPMRKKGCATWDGGNSTWGGRARVIVKQKNDGIFICQDKYVVEILKKFGFTEVNNASTPMETQKPLLKDKDGKEVDVHMYLKDHPKLGIWYLKDSPFDLVAYTDSDYAGASLDKNSTTGGCQYLGRRLISWQCKKQIVVVNSTTEAEYMAASSCCGQVL
uniref:Uncharacterized protein n=1 Tax=Tanacetum cinerariifolium TaxID=118510 RepID=A0A6L2MFU6_TANCI|nr:hypothetical protein [Tanacetum cinerariifolium]